MLTNKGRVNDELLFKFTKNKISSRIIQIPNKNYNSIALAN